MSLRDQLRWRNSWYLPRPVRAAKSDRSRVFENRPESLTKLTTRLSKEGKARVSVSLGHKETAGTEDPLTSFPLQSILEEMKMSSTAQKRKVGKVMHECREGSLKSGSSRKVKSCKQAVAIAMSESGQSKRPKKAS